MLFDLHQSSLQNHDRFGKSKLLITGKRCSKINFTRASRELSVTIDPSLLLKNTPPMISWWDYSKLNWLSDNFDSISFPVSLSIISLNDLSHFPKTDCAIDLCSVLTSTDTFFSIILSIPFAIIKLHTWTIKLCKCFEYYSLLLIFSLNFLSNNDFNSSTNSCLACILMIRCLLITEDF